MLLEVLVAVEVVDELEVCLELPPVVVLCLGVPTLSARLLSLNF